MTALFCWPIGVLAVLCLAWLIRELVTAPFGREIDGIGFVYTDENGNPVV